MEPITNSGASKSVKKDQIRISNDVISVIASLAVADELGNEKSSKKAAKGKGISVDVEEDKIRIGVDLTVSYGTKIPELAENIQSKVKTSVENMTGMQVESVSVTVSGMNIDKQVKE
ncbi:MAG: Asp23/Gls24 family envelope stress response protein [Firmicutes bacterium]|nr:Asp23/Gls24 family envelope stress response protein [Bacillota bacterium]